VKIKTAVRLRKEKGEKKQMQVKKSEFLHKIACYRETGSMPEIWSPWAAVRRDRE